MKKKHKLILIIIASLTFIIEGIITDEKIMVKLGGGL